MRSTLRFPRQTSVRLERSPVDFAVIFALLLLLTWLIVLLGWQFWYTSRIYSGVSVAGVPVGGLTRARALDQLSQHLENYPLPPINLYYGTQQWPLTGEQVKAQTDLMAATNQAYLIGRQGSFAQRTFGQLFAAVRGKEITPPLKINVAQLRYAIGQVAKEVRRPGRVGNQIGNGQVPAQNGLDVDVEATLLSVQQALVTAAPAQIINVPLVVIELSPPAATTSATQASQHSAIPVLSPMLLRDDKFNLQFALDSATLSRLLVSTKPPQLDEKGLRTLVTEWATQVVIPARDARLDFNPDSGALTVMQPSQSGRKLDIEATLAGIHQAVNVGQNQAALVMVDELPAVDMNNVANMGIRELVASGVSYFRGSPAERVQNIEVGAAKLDGVVIPPDTIFSFDKYVEEVTGANGFADSLIIWGDQTATGAGGGICQVSTTVFRAAFTGGLPIVERYNHGYVVGWYGDPGLDATIFTPSVDFRFRNDTGAYLLLKPLVDSTNSVITINLYGTKPNRQVTIKPAVQSDVQEPEPPQYKVDNSLAKGQITQVESAHKGLSVSVERVILENGTSRTDSVVSKYQPWRAVYLVGPGTEVPNVAATAIPTPTVGLTATNGVTPTTEQLSAP